MDLPSAAAAALAAAENDAVAAAHAGPVPTGRLLSGDTVLDVDALLPGEQSHELKVRTLLPVC